MYREKVMSGMSGWLMLFALIPAIGGSTTALVFAARAQDAWSVVGWVLLLVLLGICMGGFTAVNPNEARVIVLLGNYKGTLKDAGFRWVNPLTTRKVVSLRVRNFESARLKVNDHTGNPIEIAAIVVWQVVETAEAMFQVDDYEHFVRVQTEAAVRNLAALYPYDAHQDGEKALRSHAAEIAAEMRREIQERLAQAGVQVLEARISHLAYAPEIAGAMLRRQQASAIVAARQKFVEGAVGMVEMALDMLSKKNVVELDNERKASMVSNMLVVLCSDQHTQPVVNTGSLYQ